MEPRNKHIDKYIIFSHGFGVRKDSRGMFTEISEWFPEYECVSFGYNELLENNTIVASSLTDQSKKFSEVLLQLNNENPEAEIFVIAHSQGGIPVALAAQGVIKKIILLAPSVSSDINKSIEYFMKYPGTHIDLEGKSILERRDGSKTIVPKEFWEDRKKYEPIILYNALGKKYDTVIVFADQDEIVSNKIENLDSNITQIHIDADHNFTGNARNELKKVLFEILQK